MLMSSPMLDPLMSLYLHSVLSRLIVSSTTFIHLLRKNGYPLSFFPTAFSLLLYLPAVWHFLK